MKLGLDGKVALVTGGSRGIGAAIVSALAGEGCHVAFNHLGDAERAAEVAAEVRGLGRRALVFESDVSNFAEPQRQLAQIATELGPLDILICNAGIHQDRASWNMSEDEWDRVLAVNLKGSFNYCRAAAKVFRERKAGRIVNVASINGIRGKFGQANYAASKGGLIALTCTLAKELGPAGVTVNAVAPGLVQTEMTRGAEAVVAAALARSLLGRAAEPEDVAALVLFLCGAPARHITGTCIPIDGGQLL